MKLMRSRAFEGSVVVPGDGLNIAVGSIVDVDQPFGDATLADHLGSHLSYFDPVVEEGFDRPAPPQPAPAPSEAGDE
jgi:hypothetical protein